MLNDRGLVFLHIPKTAGTTLRKIIDRQYPRRLIYHVTSRDDRERFFTLPEQQRRKLLVVQGHIGYGVHEYLSVPVDYVTMLRHPVDLLMSMYYSAPKGHSERMGHSLDDRGLAEFADSELPTVRNFQTRVLSGFPTSPDEAGLLVAKDNLTARVAVFGLNERFDESLMLFARRLGWRNVFYRPLNTNRRRPGRQALPRSTVALIEKNNALDMELYDFAARTFEARISRQEPAFWEDLRRFQQWNPVCGFLYEACRKVRWGMPKRARMFIGEHLRSA